MKTRNLAISLVFALLLAALPAVAGAASWNDRVAESEQALVDGEYAAALAVTAPLLDEMGRRLAPGEQSESALGSVYALHALALAGTGDEGAAAWYWSLAESFKPTLSGIDLAASYGAAGAALEEAVAACPAWSAVAAGEEDERFLRLDDTGAAEGAEVEPPEKLAAPQPEYSRALREAAVGGSVAIQTVIDEEGRLRCAHVERSDHPVFAYLTAEAMRDWRFEPARKDGEPVAVIYTLRTGFEVGRR